MPDVRKLHDESVANLGKGTRREIGVVRKTDFQPPKDTKDGKSKGGKK